MFSGKCVLKICSKFTGEHPYRSTISLKLLCNFIEIVLWHECSPISWLHIFWTAFYKTYTFKSWLYSSVSWNPTARYTWNVLLVVVVITGFVMLFLLNCFVFVEARTYLRRTEKISQSIKKPRSNPALNETINKIILKWSNIGLILCFILFWTNFSFLLSDF